MLVGLLGLLTTLSWARALLIAGLVTVSTGMILSFFAIENGGTSA